MKPKTRLSSVESSKNYREKHKALGYVFLSVMVLKESVAKIKAIEAADKAPKKGV